MQTLKDLTIEIIVLKKNPTNSYWRSIYDSYMSKDLDLVLSSFLVLQRMVIHLHHEAIPSQFWVGIHESMLLTEERGVLIIKYNSHA